MTTQETPTPRPIGDQVLVRQDPRQDQVGRFYVPQGSEEWPPTGTVVALGARVGGDHPPGFAAGDRVIFRRRPSSALVPDSRESDAGNPWRDLVMLREDDVLAVIE